MKKSRVKIDPCIHYANLIGASKSGLMLIFPMEKEQDGEKMYIYICIYVHIMYFSGPLGKPNLDASYTFSTTIYIHE